MTQFTETQRLEFIAETLAGHKWADKLPMFRPRNVLNENTEKWIPHDTDSFRAAIDYCMVRGLNPNG